MKSSKIGKRKCVNKKGCIRPCKKWKRHSLNTKEYNLLAQTGLQRPSPIVTDATQRLLQIANDALRNRDRSF